MGGKRGIQVGAAAFALGVSLAGPQLAVATADTTPDSPSVSAGTDARPNTPARSRQGTPRVARTSAPRRNRSRPAPSNAARPVAPPTKTAVDADLNPAAGPARPAPARPTPAPAAALRTAPRASATAPAPLAAATTHPDCPQCRAAQAQAHAQAFRHPLATAINRAFNNAFTLLAGGGAFSELLTGALVLVRRTMFLIPEGVTASPTQNGLTVNVTTNGVAYFRQDGSGVQVSGDPRFWGSKTYTVHAVSVVENGERTGVVLTSGTVDANLTTVQIDSLRFQSGSAFTGMVTATTSGVLTLRDAVRGLTGVTLNAPSVVLADDVEVDGGSGAAMFAGTVDADRAGRQSLTVTALGTTTFGADVGGSAALATLLTQGIAPVSITQSADTKTIRLHFLPWVENAYSGMNEVKYGIDVALGDNPSQVYEFDTGGNGFFAGYNKPFFQGVPLTSDPVSILFTSGNQFNAVVATPTVTIGTGTQTVTTAQPIDIGAIMSGSSPKTGSFDFTDPAAPPIEGSFFGDFGASLAVLPVSGTSYVLANPLLQLPGKLSNGYLVQLGPIGVTPQVTVGLTDELRAQFPYAVPIAPTQSGGTYPVSGWPELNVFGISPQYFAQKDAGSQPVPIGCDPGDTCTLPTIVDSGAPSMSIRLGGEPGPYDDGGQLKSGVTFIAEFPTAEGKPALTWTFVAGNNGSVNLADYGDKSAAFAGNNLNTGLNLYNFYDVIFDVQDQVLRLRPTGGQSTVIANSVTTTGTQSYRQNAELNGNYVTGGADFSVAGTTTLNGDTVVDAGAGDVTFSGNVDSVSGASPTPMALAVKSSGTTTFARSVGGLAELSSLTTDAGGRTDSFQVHTLNTQNYGDDVTLQGRYLTDQGSFLVSGDATLAAAVSVQALDEYGSPFPPQPGGITFSGTIDGQPGRAYPLMLITGGGRISLAGEVGSTNPLGGLTIASVGAPAGTNTEFAAGARITMDGSLGFADDKGLVIGTGVTTTLTSGGLIRNFSSYGIAVTSTAGTQISNFTVSGSGQANILGQSAENLVITNNAVSGGTGAGVELDQAKAVTLSNNSIRGTGGAGVLADALKNSVISNNDISANDGDGISLTDSETLTISGNTINSNGATGKVSFNGIFSTGGSKIEILANTITKNGYDGVSVRDLTDATIADNTITGNVSHGIALDGSTGVIVESNTISGNSYDGVYATKLNDSTLFDNAITGNGANGIELDESTDLTINGNTISGNGNAKNGPQYNGVYSAHSTTISIFRNVISDNGYNGVSVDKGSTGNEILTNSIFGNNAGDVGGLGISLNNGAGNAGQAAPTNVQALRSPFLLVVSGTLNTPGTYSIQVFYSPTSDAGNVEGREVLGNQDVSITGGDFSFALPLDELLPAGFITVTATPTTGAPNTSEFSNAASI